MGIAEIKAKIAVLNKQEAMSIAVKQFSELYEKVDEKDLDISKVELVISNAFSAGVIYKEAVVEKTISEQKTYLDGLQDMYDAAVCVFPYFVEQGQFEDDLQREQNKLEELYKK